MSDRIVAISTPPGEGAVGIVRLSGSGVVETVSGFFHPYNKDLPLTLRNNFSLNLGWLLDLEGEKIDEVLVSVMRAPHSYTGEDVVEINCHGGSLAIRRCLKRCLDTGVRLAEPGEFTKRAFLNDRLELSQAEAVIDIIRAKTDRGLKLAVQQLGGRQGQLIADLEEQLLHLNAMLEASLDFPDEVGDLDDAEARRILESCINKIKQLLKAGQRAEVYRDGINMVICGKPNVGKSSLLNALAQKERAIVTDIPGTTRDVIEEYINIRGIPVKIVDTAGIRETEDLVELIGVQKSKEVIENADLVLFMVDFSAGISDEDMDIFAGIPAEKMIVLVNKEDIEDKKISPAELREKFQNMTVIKSSVKMETGLDELEQAVYDLVLGTETMHDGLEIMINLRQKLALQNSLAHMQAALEALGTMPLDCLGVDIWGALERLGELSGKSLKEDIIDRIFHDFCIGK
ncbi:tRNA modification GTPase MnmE [Syntrophomonas zehnderi OL-4]|uniref:tRNA modification GTPase MnmE n=1 Tax=Syntrophomonas zehnderi OL-4 TaxID=690567 RepID=A0A0E4GCV0_9FIRM|nr:tRNA uridine-5-carboxymethylaminomethyl(34) synthesis GTPase MnmE [Syntrophomonas zehnderi]CFX25344.1 tRNA modification GTPase MnmE [Syntrophomonas zehnderi OL-4]